MFEQVRVRLQFGKNRHELPRSKDVIGNDRLQLTY